MSTSDTSVALVLTQDHDEGRVRLLTLNRHSTRNSLDTLMCQAIESELLRAVDDGVRAVVMTGAGTAFSSGADLSGGVYAGDFYSTHLHMLDTIRTMPIPVIAAVNGPAVGAGTQLAMACDLRIIDKGAYFRVPVVDVAISLDEVTIRTLELLVGGSRARTMLLTGATLDHQGALDSGFALAAGSLIDALTLASHCATKAPLSLRHFKMEFAHSSGRPFDAADREDAQRAAWTSKDVQEARVAREEKRAPRFQGR